MPAAEPIRWAVCRTPPALPARSTGTCESDSVWLGEMTNPPPSPAMNSGSAVYSATSDPGSARTASQTPTKPTITATGRRR